MKDIVTDSLRYWEPRRIAFNAVLAPGRRRLFFISPAAPGRAGLATR